MPIKIPDGLPAEAVLHSEGVPTIRESIAFKQDIRPLKMCLLNLMPKKITTETQFIRLLGQSPLQIQLTLLRIERKSKNTSLRHIDAFYKTWKEIQNERFDGLIITGAPVEHLEFEQVSYWSQLCDILDWSKTNTTKIMSVCWGAQAVLKYFYGIEKHNLPQKAFGVYRHQVITPKDYLLRGLNDRYYAPVSRHTGINRKDIDRETQLKLCVSCPYTGPAVAQSISYRETYFFNHVEYDSTTLAEEYNRDKKMNLSPAIPVNYFPDDDDRLKPVNRWRSVAHLFFRNWIDDVYLSTPYDESQIGKSFSQRHLLDLEHSITKKAYIES